MTYDLATMTDRELFEAKRALDEQVVAAREQMAVIQQEEDRRSTAAEEARKALSASQAGSGTDAQLGHIESESEVH